MNSKDVNKINVGKKIKQIRLSRGWTLKQFSDELSNIIGENKTIAEGVISRWESGVSLPNPKRLKAIAKIADISVEELLYGSIFRQHFNEYWTQLINNVEYTTKEYCINDVQYTSKEYCIINIEDIPEDIPKEYFTIDQKEFEYIKSNKEKLYDIFYKTILEYGYSDNNNNYNFALFALAIQSLLKQYYSVKGTDINLLSTVVNAVSKTSKELMELTLTALNAGKQTTNIKEKLFYFTLVELTEEYCMKIDKIFPLIRQDNEESTL